MTSNTNGNGNSNPPKSVATRREELDAMLLAYSDKMIPRVDEDIAAILGMKYESMHALDANAAFSAAFSLKKKAIQIRLDRNLQQARIKWARSRLYECMAENNDQFSQFDKFDFRGYILGRTNTYVRDLLKVIEFAERYSTMMDNMADDVRSVANTFEDIGRTKLRGEK